MPKVFVTGISGYIGGTIAVKLREKGHEVLGLVRKAEASQALEARGYKVVKGTLQDRNVLEKAIGWSDAVVHAADSDDPAVADRFLSILEGTGKTFIYTSGSAIVANWDRPETAEFVYTEDFPLETASPFGSRVAINNTILRSAIRNIRSIVIVPSMVYGTGLLLAKDSKQIPRLIRTARERGCAVYVSEGTQSWNNVHVEDLADLYIHALEKAKAGSYFFAENGMTSFRELAQGIRQKLGFAGEPEALNVPDAVSLWDEMTATVALGSNCRINADKARLFLGWQPRYGSPLPFI